MDPTMTVSTDDLARLSDEALIRRVAQIDTKAFGVLYDRHSVTAFSLARRMVRGPNAEDVVQDAFLNVWRSAARYDPERGPVKAWLMGIVRNRGIDALRGLDVHERRRVDAEHIEGWLASPDETDDQVMRAETSIVVRRALAKLSSEQQTVLSLAYFGGYSQTEIAERLDVPLGTVKGRTRLGLDKLRTALDASARTPG